MPVEAFRARIERVLAARARAGRRPLCRLRLAVPGAAGAGAVAGGASGACAHFLRYLSSMSAVARCTGRHRRGSGRPPRLRRWPRPGASPRATPADPVAAVPAPAPQTLDAAWPALRRRAPPQALPATEHCVRRPAGRPDPDARIAAADPPASTTRRLQGGAKFPTGGRCRQQAACTSPRAPPATHAGGSADPVQMPEPTVQRSQPWRRS